MSSNAHTRARSRRLSGDDLPIPDLKSAADLAIAERLRRAVPSASNARQLGGARFGRELNVTDDRAVLRGSVGDGLPVIEGKHIDGIPALRRARSSHVVDRVGRATPTGCLHAGIFAAVSRLASDVASPDESPDADACRSPPAGCVSTHAVFCRAHAARRRRAALPFAECSTASS